jgi:antitoxin component of MazEF toxin-antitoxin module
MQLQKQLSRRVGNKAYPKWVIAIPPRQIEALGWREGQSLESEIANSQLIVRTVDESEVEKRKEAARKAWKTRKQTEGHK